MKKILFVSFFMTLNLCVYAQNTFKAVIKDSEKKELLMGVTAQVTGTTIATTSDENGQIILTGIPNGLQVIQFSYVGFAQRTDSFNFPLEDTTPIEILLYESSTELDGIVISSTRSTRTIQNIPTRIEFIGREELDEKGNMKAGDIRMLLSESTGIHVQTTSPTITSRPTLVNGSEVGDAAV